MAVETNNKGVTIAQAVILKDHLEGEINDVDAKADTLIGEDSGKSARNIANEELTKQLIPENAKESLDTLQEIAGWIQQHPDDAAAMNTAIGANTSAISAINDPETGIAKTAKDYTDGKDSAMDARVTALENKTDGIDIATDDEFFAALGIPAPNTGG